MSENKSSQIMLSLEPTFYLILEELSSKEKTRIPAFIRKIIIEEIQRRGLLNHEDLIRIIK